jgi:hypothetical protein
MKVSCTIDYMTLESDSGREIDSVEVTCKRCDHSTQSYGDGAASVRRCLVLLREECPRHEENYYAAEGGEDEC